ncbi:TIGR01777 family oxidoreductase [Colwellia sp. RSH04]|uniref:TIGR01777 family oxidoreductase n=1 Tax=Colwellia sp. RSH04 TaxID=2305464 RepID=UPI000E580270|nr:TIGR01777 family oxidoreductase [Colwellia sp. RSH04]RHW75037.1 TIGR01777 family protein [Colwellia sp. RSH04]
MNYLITGGTGLIGRQLITRLMTSPSDEKANITVLTRDINKANASGNKNITYIEKLSLAVIESSDVVINLAGEPIADKRWSKNQKQLVCNSRWHITQTLVSLMQQTQNPPTIFISGSAIGIYGRQNNSPIDESFSQFNEEFSNTVCEQWEHIALNAQSEKTRVSVIRTGIVLSTQGGALKKMLTPFKFGLGGNIGKGTQMMSWIHIDDMVSGIVHIINNDTLNGPINMTSPNAVSNEEFSSTLATTLKRPCFMDMPSFVVKTLFGEMSDLLLFGQNIIPKKLIDNDYSFAFENLESALSDLLTEPKPKK